jgi:hypothetical protein
VAGLRGVEPPTTWFVARCSIQLSYRPAETTHAFLLDYDTLPATSTAPIDCYRSIYLPDASRGSSHSQVRAKNLVLAARTRIAPGLSWSAAARLS